MNLSRIFDPNLIRIKMNVKSKDEAIDQLVDLFCAQNPDKDS